MSAVQLFKVTKRFTGGLLKGQTRTYVTPIQDNVGRQHENPYNGLPYEIIAFEEVQLEKGT